MSLRVELEVELEPRICTILYLNLVPASRLCCFRRGTYLLCDMLIFCDDLEC